MVVVGYATSKKMSVTGSIVTIGGQGVMSRNVAASPGYYYRRQPGPEIRKDHKKYKDDLDREGYDHITENPFLRSKDNPLSTFSIDVDGASYSNIRRFINDGKLPPDGAVRIEEMINYFSYKYPQPAGNAPFSINTGYTVCPWNRQHQLVSIGLQGRKIATENYRRPILFS
ncbi:von Willebrand factor type A domain-containing protein [Niabella sp. W65]|nr:von Willebrand factor type A domain-containing protein [Niabella sp. W65]MCH7366819.1 von Willebrand factor type A domain-containing protein [Niabella sp. W65]